MKRSEYIVKSWNTYTVGTAGKTKVPFVFCLDFFDYFFGQCKKVWGEKNYIESNLNFFDKSELCLYNQIQVI